MKPQNPIDAINYYFDAIDDLAKESGWTEDEPKKKTMDERLRHSANDEDVLRDDASERWDK